MRFSLSVINVIAFLFLTLLILSSCGGKSDPISPASLINETNSTGNIDVTEPDTGAAVKAGTDPVWESYYQTEDSYAPYQVLIGINPGVLPDGPDDNVNASASQALLNLASQNGIKIIEKLKISWDDVFLCEIIDGTPVVPKAQALMLLSEVRYAQPNYKVYFSEAPYVPNDPMFENPNDNDDDPRTNVFEQFGPSKTGAYVCWNENKGDPNVLVAVLDTGVMWDHEDLADNIWYNEAEVNGVDGVDDDNNGYVDDIRGWDTAQDDNDPKEYGAGGSFHGTACAGVVAAVMDNNLGCTGMAPGVRVIAVKVNLSGGQGYINSVAEGVNYAMVNNADIMSMSFRHYPGTLNDQVMIDAMNAAWDEGVIPVGGAGNEDITTPVIPASLDSVISVGGTSPFLANPTYNPIDEVRISVSTGFGWGSNYGSTVEVMAYGEDYITTYGGGTNQYWDGQNDFFFGGTSNATPMVAGAIALLKSFHPTEDHLWLRERIAQTADDLYTPGFDIQSANGRINLIRAVYGVDRYEAEEDPNGFVDLAAHAGRIYDSLNNRDSGDYIDPEDTYKVTATENKIMILDLDIFSWGENLDMFLYDNPAMLPGNLLQASTGDNHANSSNEGIGYEVQAGETYYIKVTAPDLGDSTAYGLSFEYVDDNFSVDPDWFPQSTVYNYTDGMPVVSLEFSVTWRRILSEMYISSRGSMPADKITGMHLYVDTDGSKTFNGGDQKIADATISGTNRFGFKNLNEVISFNDSPLMYFLTLDLDNITASGEFELVIDNYKGIDVMDGKTLPPSEFPIIFGPWQVDYDNVPPAWNSTTGIQDAQPKYNAALLRWNGAADSTSPPVEFNVYWSDTLPFDFGTASKLSDVPFTNGSGFAHQYLLTGLENGKEFYVAVRAQDQVGNEDANEVVIAVTPAIVWDPAFPQVIGSFNTSGDAWEVWADGPNQRIFVADSNGGVVILDVSDPSSPSFIDSVPLPNIVGIWYDGTYIYAAGEAGLYIIDPDDPGGATLLSISTYSNAADVCVVGNFAYLTQFSTGLKPFDVTDPFNPIGYPEVGDGNRGYGIDTQNGYLYVAYNNRPRVFGLADPTAPNQITEFGGNGSYEIDPEGDRVYVTYWGEHRFSTYDISDPEDPQFLVSYTSNSGLFGSDIIPFNGYLYFGTNNHYIESLNVDNTSNYFEVGQVATGGPDGLATDGSFIYSAENADGIKVIL